MAVLTAYFDETGHTADPHVVAFGILGLRATDEAWGSFSETWRRVLEAEGVSYLHMREFYGKSTKPYADWSHEKKMAFLLRLVDLIETVKPPLGRLEALPADPKERENLQESYREAYHGALRSALQVTKGTSKVNFVFADHPEINHKTLTQYHEWTMDGYRQLYGNEMLGSITFGDPRDCPALQAADLVAWEFARHQRDVKELRPTLRRLTDMGPRIYR